MPQVTYIGLPALIARGMGALEHAVGQAAEDLQGRAQAQLADHVVTGNLKASIHVDGPEAAGMGVEAKVATGGESSEYAIPQHEGSAPHVIRPRNGKVLAFNGTFATVVNHPGNPPLKYLEIPLIEMAPVYRAYLHRAARSAY